MHTLSFLLLPTVAFLVGCGGLSNHYNVKIDPTFSPEQKVNVAQALYAWSGALPELSYDLSVEDCPPTLETDRICIVNTTHAYVEARRDSTTAAYTWTTPNNRDSAVYIPTDDPASQDAAVQTQLITHEIGHALGLKHTAEGTLMCITIWDNGAGCGAEFITCNDIAQYKSLRDEPALECK